MDPQAPVPTPIEARCAIHEGQPFTSVCNRCGTYMCSQCSEGGRFERCAACRERTGMGTLTVRRDNWTVDAIMRHAYAAYRQNLGYLSVGTVIMFGAVSVINMVSSVFQLFFDKPEITIALTVFMFVPQTLVQGYFSLGLLAMALAAARGERAELSLLFSGMSKLGGFVLQTLVMYLPAVPFAAAVGLIVWTMGFEITKPELWMALGLLTLVSIPIGIYLGLGFTFGTTELVAQPSVTAMAALKNSFRLVAGQRLRLCLMFLIAAGLCTLGILACFIGLLFAAGYCAVMFATLYLALRDGAEGLERE